jgi:GTPase SAR1 family protein
MARTRKTYKNIRNILQIENDIITYLNTHLDNNKSIALYGKGGVGKTSLLQRIMPYFEERGYTNFKCEEIPVSLGMDTRNAKRSNTWVIETRDENIFNDERFVTFDLSL